LAFARHWKRIAVARNLSCIVDLRKSTELTEAARKAGIEVLSGSVVTHASGGKRVAAINVVNLNGGERHIDLRPSARIRRLQPGGASCSANRPAPSATTRSSPAFCPISTGQSVETTGAVNGDFGESLNIQPLWSVQTLLGARTAGQALSSTSRMT
jgi:hypothetical protein